MPLVQQSIIIILALPKYIKLYLKLSQLRKLEGLILDKNQSLKMWYLVAALQPVSEKEWDNEHNPKSKPKTKWDKVKRLQRKIDKRDKVNTKTDRQKKKRASKQKNNLK